jgi:hypothetical protein
MIAGFKEAEAAAAGSGLRRHAYAVPRLARYGSLRCVTTSGTVTGKESGSCTQNKAIRC